MKNKKDILPDELFRQNLDGFEVPYNPAAWDHMQTMLEQGKAEKPVGFVIMPKNHRKKIIITMATLTIVSGLLLWTASFVKDHTSVSAVPASKTNAGEVRKENNAVAEIAASEKSVAYAKAGKAALNATAKTSKTAATSLTPSSAAESPGSVVKQPEMPTATGTVVESAGGTATAVLAENPKLNEGTGETPVVAPRQPSFRLTPFGVRSITGSTAALQRDPMGVNLPGSGKIRHSYAFNDGFIGIHFTWQEPLEKTTHDSFRQNAGFNIQFMSNNLSRLDPWGAYLGFDWGMQFYGHGNKNNVQLNTTAGDSGWTRLSTFSMDFFARGHLEYARYRIIPYVNVFAGPRLYSTNQRVSSYLPLKNNESSDMSNAATYLSMMGGGSVGLRVRVSDVVSLDARAEYMRGTSVKMVDLDNSSFNGLNYDLMRFNLAPEYYQFKFGILFNLGDDDASDDHRTYNNNQSSYTIQTEEPGYYYFDSATNSWLEVPLCPCTCDSTGKKIDPKSIKRSYKKPTEAQPDINGTGQNRGWQMTPDPDGAVIQPAPGRNRTRSGSSSSPSINLPSGSGGKGGFPGISPGGGGGGIKIKS